MDSLPDSSFTLYSVIPRILFMQNICLLRMQTAPSQTNAYIIAKCTFAQFSFRSVMKNGRPHVKTISTRNNYLAEQFHNLDSTGDNTRTRHVPDRTHLVVKIYTPLKRGCRIPRPLSIHTRSRVTKYEFPFEDPCLQPVRPFNLIWY